ncbi:MAG: porin [Proteobacteria bacterium]|nr:porin [Pseudomonadota bacterium]
MKRQITVLLSGLLVAGELLLSAPALATAEDARLDAMQKQLQQMQATLQQLADENRELREHERQLDQEVAQLKAQAPRGGAMLAQGPADASALPAGTGALPAPATAGGATPAPAAQVTPQLRLWGYGEVYYIAPTEVRRDTTMDLARAVFGIGYRLDERTEFNSEYEVEHAVASSEDVGEFEVEQFWVDRRLNDAVSARAGLFLMPFGFINESHEPTAFYGVQRNFVETLIIPSTWREGGVNLHGQTRGGLGWNAGLTTGVNLSEWDFAPETPPYDSALQMINNGAGPLAASHQELALANARYLSQYLALGYYGIPGVTLGAAISTGDAVPVAPAAGAPASANPRVTLWEAHARWMPGDWDLSALYAHGHISNLYAANAANPGSPNPIPTNFYGWYAQAAYQLWEHEAYRFNPFARYEYYSLGSSWSGTTGPQLPAGNVPLGDGSYGPWPTWHDRVWTAGANFYIGPHLVLKADYQWFDENPQFRRFDLGLGVSF